MTEELEIDTYLSISSSKLGIYLLDKSNLSIFYKEEFKFQNNSKYIDLNRLTIFLEMNIFKIEKLIGKFITNIFLVIENNNLFNLFMGVKKKNYEKNIDKKKLESTLTDAKDLFKENHQDYRIMHMLINNYIIDGKYYKEFNNNFNTDALCLELQFISISNDFVSEIDKVIEKYQIKIVKYLDQNYINSVIEDSKIELPKKAHLIQTGYNENEVLFVPKNLKKIGFFEKFFQLFS